MIFVWEPALLFQLGAVLFLKLIPNFDSSRKLACSIGLETGFFSSIQAHRILNSFNGYHVNQLRRIGHSLVGEFGNAPRSDLIVVDIDQSVRSTYAQKREGATFVKSQKHGHLCLQWSVAFSTGEVIDQQLKEGYRHCIDDLEERYHTSKKILGRIDILRIDGGYLSADNLNLLKDQLFCTKAGINLNCVKEGLKKATGRYWKKVDEHTKIFDCGLRDIFQEVSQQFRLILVKGQKQLKRRIPKNKCKQGKGYRSYCITYQEIIFAILTNIEGNPLHIYTFYKQRQTIENYFRDSNWSFETSKLPSQQFRANQSYLWLTTIVQNALVWFKRQCLPDDWQSGSIQKIRDELINRKALVSEKSGYIQINFSIYFKHKEVHDFAANRLELLKNSLDNGEPLENFWKFAVKPSSPSKIEILKSEQP